MKRAAPWFRILLCACVSIWPALAGAHEVGLSRGTYRALDSGVRASLSVSRAEVTALVPELDADRDGFVTPREVAAAAPAFERALLAKISVSRGSVRCTPSSSKTTLEEPDGILLERQYRCAKSPEKLTVRLDMLQALSRSHRHLAKLETTAGVSEELLYGDRIEISLAAPAPSGAAVEPKSSSFLDFSRLGFEHILIGYDHLLFLFVLVLAETRRRALLGITASFTIAHSLTLACAVLGFWAPSPKWVEPLIALSIAYVALENLLRRQPQRRWLLTAAFGLVHGFGFAGALLEAGITRGRAPLALLSFNLGVELGQVAVLGGFLVVLWLARRAAWYPRYALPALNGIALLCGVGWFGERAWAALRANDSVMAEMSRPTRSLPFTVSPLGASSPALGTRAEPQASAEELCSALHLTPGQRVAECCGSTPTRFLYAECTLVWVGASNDGHLRRVKYLARAPQSAWGESIRQLARAPQPPPQASDTPVTTRLDTLTPNTTQALAFTRCSSALHRACPALCGRSCACKPKRLTARAESSCAPTSTTSSRVCRAAA